MSRHSQLQHFDVIGNGFVQEHHADDRHHQLIEREQGASGSAWTWLGFYLLAVLVVAGSHGSNQAAVVLASTH